MLLQGLIRTTNKVTWLLGLMHEPSEKTHLIRIEFSHLSLFGSPWSVIWSCMRELKKGSGEVGFHTNNNICAHSANGVTWFSSTRNLDSNEVRVFSLRCTCAHSAIEWRDKNRSSISRWETSTRMKWLAVQMESHFSPWFPRFLTLTHDFNFSHVTPIAEWAQQSSCVTLLYSWNEQNYSV